MLKVLVVDDDKLVRKGLIAAMPWSDYGMQVIGEANNGEKAMEFLAANETDLVLVDLAMPIMSGIEMMRAAKPLYPKLFFVVLTLHQDFEYIQEALRLGAIDYIAKVQLEKERFEEILGRIRDRIVQERNKNDFQEMRSKAMKPFDQNEGFVLISTNEQAETEWIHTICEEMEMECNEISSGLWLCTMDQEAPSEYINKILQSEGFKQTGWVLLKLTGIAGQNRSVVNRLLRRYRQKDFFYELDHDRVLAKDLQDIDKAVSEILPEGKLAELAERICSFQWICNKELTDKLLFDLKTLCLPVSQLFHLLIIMENEWNRIYSSIVARKIKAPVDAGSWKDVEVWIRSIADATIRQLTRQIYSSEVYECIMQAVKIIDEEIDQQVFAGDVAKRVNMSRSYFNQCFKLIVGKPFNEYLRFIRVNRAKEYLLKTSKPVQWIAEQTGYMDEKYFSHVFRKLTGYLPSEYRQKNMKED
jgi:two-component system response regulator YesN